MILIISFKHSVDIEIGCCMAVNPPTLLIKEPQMHSAPVPVGKERGGTREELLRSNTKLLNFLAGFCYSLFAFKLCRVLIS